MIILGVTYAMILVNQRPYLKDVHRVLIFGTFLLGVMYVVNYLWERQPTIGSNGEAYRR